MMTPHIWICDEKNTQNILVDNLNNRSVVIYVQMKNSNSPNNYLNFPITIQPGLKLLDFKVFYNLNINIIYEQNLMKFFLVKA